MLSWWIRDILSSVIVIVIGVMWLVRILIEYL